MGGSFRRRKEVVRDLDFVASTGNPQAVGDWFVTLPLVEGVIAHGLTKVSVRLRDGIQCDLRLVSETEYPYALHHFTGSKEHHIALRNRALETRGWSINDYRISVADENKPHDPLPTITDETEFYRALGLNYIPPELRENLGEIEAAANGSLPELVEPENLRGTFHCHTTASDGHNTLEEMADAARELGCNTWASATTAKARFRRTARTSDGWPNRAGRSGGSTKDTSGKTRNSGCSRASSATCTRTARWISPTRCSPRWTTWW